MVCALDPGYACADKRGQNCRVYERKIWFFWTSEDCDSAHADAGRACSLRVRLLRDCRVGVRLMQ